jgi:hypothetical protein
MRILAVFLLCPLLSGCLGFGYPSVTRTPAIQVDEPDVQAFRVMTDRILTDSKGFLPGGQSYPIVLPLTTTEKLPSTPRTISPQSDAYFDYRLLVFPIVSEGYSRSLEIRLYRRGYETVSIPAEAWLPFSEQQAKPQWKKVADLADFEKAIEGIGASSLGDLFRPSSQDVRQFVAQEYAWLAQSEWAAGPDRETDRQRLLDKAKKFKQAKSPWKVEDE